MSGKPEGLFVVSLETGEKTPITPERPDLPTTMPAVSPDGHSVVFERAGGLYILDLKADRTRAGDSRRLTDVALAAMQPTWAPSGKEIVFAAQRSLWRMDVSGARSPERESPLSVRGLMPVLTRAPSGASMRLVYVRNWTDANIWRLNMTAAGTPASSSPVRAISSTMLDQNPQFSPDGSRVVLQSDRSGSQEIWVVDPDGANALQPTTMNAQFTGSPRWSPNGQKIVFDSNREGQFEIYEVAASGGRVRRVTSDAADDIVPSFSRDGKWIYFGSSRSAARRSGRFQAPGESLCRSHPMAAPSHSSQRMGAYVYYNQMLSPSSSLWRIASVGGDPVKLLDEVSRTFAVTETGIYYIEGLQQQSGLAFVGPTGRPGWEPRTRIRFFSFASGKSTTVADFNTSLGLGITVLADGHAILFTQSDAAKTDLEMVDNFR